MRAFVGVVLSMLGTVALANDCSVVRTVDSMTDETRVRAECTNADGYTFSLGRGDEGRVWATFRIPVGGGVLASDEPVL